MKTQLSLSEKVIILSNYICNANIDEGLRDILGIGVDVGKSTARVFAPEMKKLFKGVARAGIASVLNNDEAADYLMGKADDVFGGTVPAKVRYAIKKYEEWGYTKSFTSSEEFLVGMKDAFTTLGSEHFTSSKDVFDRFLMVMFYFGVKDTYSNVKSIPKTFTVDKYLKVEQMILQSSLFNPQLLSITKDGKEEGKEDKSSDDKPYDWFSDILKIAMNTKGFSMKGNPVNLTGVSVTRNNDFKISFTDAPDEILSKDIIPTVEVSVLSNITNIEPKKISLDVSSKDDEQKYVTIKASDISVKINSVAKDEMTGDFEVIARMIWKTDDGNPTIVTTSDWKRLPYRSIKDPSSTSESKITVFKDITSILEKESFDGAIDEDSIVIQENSKSILYTLASIGLCSVEEGSNGDESAVVDITPILNVSNRLSPKLTGNVFERGKTSIKQPDKEGKKETESSVDDKNNNKDSNKT